MDDSKLVWKYLQLKQRAEKRDIPFSLSLTRIRQLNRTKYCFYTGTLLDNEDPTSDNYFTYERLDSSKGYTDDNVVICCKRINSLKANASIQDIIDIYDGLKRKGIIK